MDVALAEEPLELYAPRCGIMRGEKMRAQERAPGNSARDGSVFSRVVEKNPGARFGARWNERGAS
jgi:hypothetical protein